MTVGLLFITDGRDDYHEAARLSAEEHLPPVDVRIHVDDPGHHLGFGGAIRHGWKAAVDADVDWLIHLEGDFTFNRPPPIRAMIAILEQRPLVQMALLRQPVNPSECAAGGIVETNPAAYQQHDTHDGCAWLEHREFFTTNPCVIPRWILEREWPTVTRSEEAFTRDLFTHHPSWNAAFWGQGEQWVRHIGTVRTGTGY